MIQIIIEVIKLLVIELVKYILDYQRRKRYEKTKVEQKEKQEDLPDRSKKTQIK